MENRFLGGDRYMELVLFVAGSDDELRNKYVCAAAKHNECMGLNRFPDSGFDIFLPGDFVSSEDKVNRINFGVKCAASIVCESGKKFATGFYMYPRSSLSKTQLRLANSVGIIDSGYRGDLIGAFDCNIHGYTVYKYDKLVQICAPGLVPIYVRVVFDIAQLGSETMRGEGGFGSTNFQDI
jgi:dUTP pyrophosphatase